MGCAVERSEERIYIQKISVCMHILSNTLQALYNQYKIPIMSRASKYNGTGSRSGNIPGGPTPSIARWEREDKPRGDTSYPQAQETIENEVNAAMTRHILSDAVYA